MGYPVGPFPDFRLWNNDREGRFLKYSLMGFYVGWFARCLVSWLTRWPVYRLSPFGSGTGAMEWWSGERSELVSCQTSKLLLLTPVF